ncbi:MAG: hypothetical protein H7255_01110 [Ramlibacter sp.]|nr:hypothetical protein [Ramlibacter sp.]
MNEPQLLDLQTQLQNDRTGTRRTGLLTQLRTLHAGCMATQRQPNDAETFTRLKAAGTALSAAIRIVETLPQAQDTRN